MHCETRPPSPFAPVRRFSARLALAASVAFIALGALATAGCGHKELWRARAVVAEGIRIMPSEISVAHGRLYIETNVYNGTQSPLSIDRDAISLTLDSGASLGRSEGTFTRHTTYLLAPGATRAVNVDFREDGFHWSQVAAARVEWNDAFTIDGSPLRIVGMDVSPRLAR